ncbi:DUF7518 family protein [Halorubrum sp. DTA98]|uniref:DUF7518 family protein n=1 Tax=Halorubrum sp. DTA98 TaxID=3402163 RepID=UPI003AB0A111
MSNRVEDLERQVAELQAAVNGLTEELVEMKERVRQVEDERAVDVEREQPAAGPTSDDGTVTDEPTEQTTHSDDHADVVERTGADAASDDGDDVVVAEQDVSTPDAEAAKGEERGDEGEDGESDDSDIIVA